AFGEGDARDNAIAALVASGDPHALPLLDAWRNGAARTQGTDRVLLVNGDSAIDAFTGAAVVSVPSDLDEVMLNNRLRRALDGGINSLELQSSDRTTRLTAAKALAADADSTALPAIKAALAKERDPEIRESLTLTSASIELASGDRDSRVDAIRTLADSDQATTRTLLQAVLARKGGQFVEADESVRAEAGKSLRAVDSRLARGDLAARIFTGISLGSILLLAALGLAITYGLMGVINMAHGELIMIGAYTTYGVQMLFRKTSFFDWYLLAAVPASFVVAGLVGVVLERVVIRWLYGRPLETLLATWGISLMLI